MNVLDTLLLALIALQCHLLSQDYDLVENTQLFVTVLIPQIGFVGFITVRVAMRACETMKFDTCKQKLITRCCHSATQATNMNPSQQTSSEALIPRTITLDITLYGSID